MIVLDTHIWIWWVHGGVAQASLPVGGKAAAGILACGLLTGSLLHPPTSRPVCLRYTLLPLAPTAFLFLLLSLFTTLAPAAEPLERTRLYTPPDPASPGGLSGRIAKPEIAIEQILAMPTADPEQVYRADLSGARKEAFVFKGLPVGKYDLVVIGEREWFEGLQLNREPTSLTPEDQQKIDGSIQKSEPFFTKKVIYRMEGETGRGHLSRAICTFVREKGSELLLTQFEGQYHRDDFRRTFKLVLLKDVGPGWQIVRARDLYPVWADPKKPLPEHRFSAALSQIRVADQVKDVGALDLSR